MNPITPAIAADRRHEGWIDTLRVLACFMVVFSHCCDGFVAAFASDYSSFLTGALLGSLMRPCVPLFAMMTGILLLPLPQEQTMGSFYHKRVGRIVPPLIFWSLALPLLAYLYFTTCGASSANPSVDMGAYTSAGLGNRLWSWVFNFNFDTTPLWYLYMLVGLYLIMPVVGAWLSRASRSDIRLFLSVWGFTLLLPYLRLLAPVVGYTGNYGNMGILGECDWNLYGTFYYVSGFIGYLVLAYYLKTYPPVWSNRKLAMICSTMFLVGYALTAGSFIWFQEHYPGDYAYLEIAWYFTGANVMMMTVPIFLMVQRLWSAQSRLMARLATLTFGIYLCHFIFVMIGYDLFNIPGFPAVARIVCNALFVFACAALLTRLLSLIPLTRPLIK